MTDIPLIKIHEPTPFRPLKIIFTGSSSFTGVHFVEALAARGHKVYACLRKQPNEYFLGPEKWRLNRLIALKKEGKIELLHPFSPAWESFTKFLDLEAFDVWCQHGAYTFGRHDQWFDPLEATRFNTMRLKDNLFACAKYGTRIVLTGSYYEAGRGGRSWRDEFRHDMNTHAIGGYGLSKTYTRMLYELWCKQLQLVLHDFTIPNPFGPGENWGVFTSYLANEWMRGQRPVVKWPKYVRDNIPVDALAQMYASFVMDERFNAVGSHHINPSGWVTTQKEFAEKFSAAMNWHLGINTPLEHADQTDFPEPATRANFYDFTDYVKWDEDAFWVSLAQYYREMYGAKSVT